MYRYILYDLDGTLTDPQEGIVNCIRESLQKMSFPPLSDETLLRFIGPPLCDSYEKFCGMDSAQSAQAIAFYRARFRTVGMLENEVIPGIPQLLHRLHQKGFRQAIASSKPEEFCIPIAAHFGLSEALDYIGGSQMEAHETKADVIERVLQALGVSDRRQALMIGDRKYDVLGAHACGIDCLGVEFCHFGEPDELQKAGAIAVVQTVAQLEQFLCCETPRFDTKL